MPKRPVKKQIKKYNYRRKDGKLIRVPTHKRTYHIGKKKSPIQSQLIQTPRQFKCLDCGSEEYSVINKSDRPESFTGVYRNLNRLRVCKKCGIPDGYYYCQKCGNYHSKYSSLGKKHFTSRKGFDYKEEIGWYKEDDVHYYATEEETEKYCGEALLPFPIIVEMEEGQFLYYNTGDEQPTGVAPTLEMAQELVSLHRDI